MSETAYELGSVLGAALLGTVLTAVFRAQIVVPPGVSGEDANVAGETLGGALDVASRYSGGTATALVNSAQQAFSSGVGFSSAVRNGCDHCRDIAAESTESVLALPLTVNLPVRAREGSH